VRHRAGEGVAVLAPGPEGAAALPLPLLPAVLAALLPSWSLLLLRPLRADSSTSSPPVAATPAARPAKSTGWSRKLPTADDHASENAEFFLADTLLLLVALLVAAAVAAAAAEGATSGSALSSSVSEPGLRNARQFEVQQLQQQTVLTGTNSCQVQLAKLPIALRCAIVPNWG